MKPEILGVSTYFLFWGVAAVFGIWTGMRLARQNGFAARPSFFALVVLALALIIGSKLLYLGEYFLFPGDDPLPLGQDNLLSALRQGFRVPGGMILIALSLPFVCRWVGLPTLAFGDAVIPAAGIAVFFVRIGCFFRGCCFGRLTEGPLGVSFPAGSRAYDWQLLNGYVGWTANHALPMHPLQLYFAALGVLLYLCGRRWQDSRHLPGQVLMNCYLLFFIGTLLLEFVRPAFLHLNLIVVPLGALIALALAIRGRQTEPAAASVPS